MAIFKGLASPTASPETAGSCSRITCTPPPPPRPGEASPRVPRALCPLCHHSAIRPKGQGHLQTRTSPSRRGEGGCWDGPLHRGPFESAPTQRAGTAPEGQGQICPASAEQTLPAPRGTRTGLPKHPAPCSACKGKAGGWRRRTGVGGGGPSHDRRSKQGTRARALLRNGMMHPLCEEPGVQGYTAAVPAGNLVQPRTQRRRQVPRSGHGV